MNDRPVLLERPSPVSQWLASLFAPSRTSIGVQLQRALRSQGVDIRTVSPACLEDLSDLIFARAKQNMLIGGRPIRRHLPFEIYNTAERLAELLGARDLGAATGPLQRASRTELMQVLNRHGIATVEGPIPDA